MIKRILGFDVSSSCIGYCLLEFDDKTNSIKFIECNFYKPTKDGNILDRLIKTREDVIEIINKYKPDYIGIENIIEYIKNRSNSKTIITLALFNRTVGLAAYDYLKKSPELFNVMTIRHGIKINKIPPKKEEIPELVSQHLGIKFPYVYKKKRNKTLEISIESYDLADGTAVALYYAFLLSGKFKKKAKK